MGLGVLTGDRNAFFSGLKSNMKIPPGGKAKRVQNPMNGLFTQREITLDERKELRERFIQEWVKLGGKTFSIKDRNELGQALKQIIQERQLQKAMRWDHPELENLKLEEIFSDTKTTLSRWPLEKKYSDWIGKAAAMDAGIVWADIAMAETGTIVLPTASPGQPASLCVLPLTLIAIFTTAQLVDGLASVMKILKERYGTNLPTTTTFISGPSRTTDIEMVLTIGVHGSRYVYALILDE
ncbi:lactate utilization protein C [Pelosinus sp. sgz500959]|uniref:LutC/YkgG family protein n=1 Tax=Pelosinus sp. sgz500959 TaxID=3242472 RepID=UPI00366E863F